MTDPYPLCSVHKNTRYFADLGCPLCERDAPPEDEEPTRKEVALQEEIARLTAHYVAAMTNWARTIGENDDLRAALAAQELHAAEMSGTIMVLQAELAASQESLASRAEHDDTGPHAGCACLTCSLKAALTTARAERDEYYTRSLANPCTQYHTTDWVERARVEEREACALVIEVSAIPSTNSHGIRQYLAKQIRQRGAP